MQLGKEIPSLAEWALWSIFTAIYLHSTVKTDGITLITLPMAYTHLPLVAGW